MRLRALLSAAAVLVAGLLLAAAPASVATVADTGWNAVVQAPAPDEATASATVLDTGWN